MNEESKDAKLVGAPPTAQILPKRRFSIVWVVPIVALLIGGWLTLKAISEKGPTITIAFENADGLEAEKTLVKFKDVEIGKVVQVELLKDLSAVVLTVEMNKDAKPFVNENTRFWVVRARVAVGKVSGLGTLFSGAYIGCAPSVEGKKQKHFKGLEKPPVLTEGLPGIHFTLKAKSLGSLDIGSPIYYRGINVGQVVGYDFDEKAEAVLIKAFVQAPYHEKVLENTRFWNASGIDLTMDATGIKLNTQSMVSIMLGGIAFDLRQHDLPKDIAVEGREFRLYPDQESGQLGAYHIKRYYLMYFDQNVRGLTPGAPVEIRGIKIGEVASVELQYDLEQLYFRIPVKIFIEPERLDSLVTEGGEIVQGDVKQDELKEDVTQIDNMMRRTQGLIDKGLRAQLKTGNLLTGQLYIDLDFYPEVKPVTLTTSEGYPVFPTIPAPIGQIVQRVDSILRDVERVPFEKIGQELQAAITEMGEALHTIKGLSANVNQSTIPKVNASLDRFEETLAGINTSLGPDSAFVYNSSQISSELISTIRTLRSLLQYLDKDPQALLMGKEGNKK